MYKLRWNAAEQTGTVAGATWTPCSARPKRTCSAPPLCASDGKGSQCTCQRHLAQRRGQLGETLT
eukprot:3773682-Pyramimonas_sp.AAC.1